MSLQNVKEEIIKQAQDEASELVSKAKKEAKQITSKAQAEVDDYKKEATVRNQNLLDAMERKMLAQARFDAQRLLMNTKKDLLKGVTKGVKVKLTKLPRAEKEQFLQNLLQKANKEIKVDTVFLCKDDISLVGDIKAEPSNIFGGLIAQNKDGTISVNLSVEELLESVEDEMLVELSGVLFGKN